MDIITQLTPLQEEIRALLVQQQVHMLTDEDKDLLNKILQSHQSDKDLIKKDGNDNTDMDQEDNIQISTDFKFEFQEKGEQRRKEQ